MPSYATPHSRNSGLTVTRDKAVDYRITHKGEPFRGHDVSLNSLSELIVILAMTPGMEIRPPAQANDGRGPPPRLAKRLALRYGT